MNRFKINMLLISALLLTCSNNSYVEATSNQNESNFSAAKDSASSIDDQAEDGMLAFLKEKLIGNIDKANEMHRDASFGNKDGQYPYEAGAELVRVMNEATEVYRDGSSSIDDINEMIYLLDQAIADFIASKIDISALKAEFLQLITETTELCNTANIGKEIGDYPEEAKDNLNNAISVANDMYNKPVDDAMEIEAAMNTLKASKEMFLNSKIKEVDFSALIFKITEMELFSQSIEIGDTPGKYPSDIKDKFDRLIQEAQLMVGSSTYKEAEDMIVKLDSAKKELSESLITYEKINRKELLEQIAIAEGLRDTAVVGNKPGEYEQESLNALYSAIYAASVINSDSLASQASIDSATATLKAKIQEFKDSVIKKEPVNMEELLGLIDQAERLILNTPVGDDINQVPEGEKEKLQNRVDSARIISELSSPTQQVIDDAAKELKQAIIDFRDKIKKAVNTETLSDEIKKAIAIQKTITDNMIGDDIGQYPLSAKEAFDKVIEAAEELLMLDTATQKEIDAMVNTLSKAIKDFKDSLIVEMTDKTLLKNTIEKAEELLAKAVIGEGDGMFPKDNYDKLTEAIKSAKVVLDSMQSTQYSIDIKVTELESAISEFLQSENTQYKDFKAQLQIKINECLEIYKSSTEGDGVGEYPTSVKNTFYKAIEKAQAVLAKDGKNSAEYTKAIDELEKAKEEFEKNAVSSEDIEMYIAEIESLLKEMSVKIKESDTSSEANRVSENKKIALSVIFNRINIAYQQLETLSEMKDVIKLAKYAISDFNDRSIYIDSKNVVHGRKLTGEVGANDIGRENVNVVDKKEFIPKAGMPVDIKATFASLGTFFIGISGVMFKRRK